MRLLHRQFLFLSVFAGLGLTAAAPPVQAAPRAVRLLAAPGLVAAGLMAHALPRFKLKTQIRVALVDTPEAAQVVLATDAPPGVAPLIEGPGGLYAAWARGDAGPDSPTARLLDWLYSEIGLRTLTAYQRAGVPLVTAAKPVAPPPQAALPEGDLALGRTLAYRNCGRCHVVGADNRMQGIGSTPSFPVLRALPDWQARFATYYQRRPHPSFTQIEGLTEPFAAMQPSPIAPLALSIDEFNAIIGYAARIAPADLGAPLVAR
ncbi:MAG TPA: hypothetical protein ENK83_08310 [Aliiroseovarius sp.]|nr:hypothetical protein [Aliiroseovarius sp.]